MKTAVKNVVVMHPEFGRLEIGIQTAKRDLMLNRVIRLAKQYGNNAKFSSQLVLELAQAYQHKSRALRAADDRNRQLSAKISELEDELYARAPKSF
jgi:hypothetical protein